MSRLPKDWKTVRLEDVAEIRTGLAKGKSYNQATIKVPYLRVANVQDGYLDLTEIKEIEVLPSEVDRYLLKFGDLLLTEGGDFDKLGRGDVWRGEISPCLHQNHVFVVRTKPEFLDPFFFAYQSASPYGKAYFLSVAKQTTNLASINSTQLKDFPVLLPPLPEQRAIAAILGTWDEAIALTSRLIDALKRRKQALMQRLLTGQTRFPEFAGEPWEELRLGDLVKALSGGTPSKNNPSYWTGDIPWVSARAMHNLYISDAEDLISEEAAIAGSKLVPSGTVLILVRGSMLYKRIPVSFTQREVAFNQDVKALIPDDRLLPEFLFYALMAQENLLLSQVETTGMGAGKLSTEILMELPIPCIGFDEQRQLTDIMVNADREIEIYARHLDALQTQKRGLMQRLLTGQVRVQPHP